MSQGKGGGPKTAAGKARSSRNAVKNAFRSPHPFIIEGLESPGDWEAFKLGIIESWQPVGVQEIELATRIAYGHWKLRRCCVYENRVLSKQVFETEHDLQEADAAEREDDEDYDEDDEDEYAGDRRKPEPAPPPPIDPYRLIANQELRVIPEPFEIDRMLRYEAFARKALAQDMRELEFQQARRRGQHPQTARVVFSSDPSAARVHMTANDLPDFQMIRQRVRMAEIGLAERRIAARERPASAIPPHLTHDQ